MKAVEELAEQAYERLVEQEREFAAATGSPQSELPPYAELSKSVKNNYLEIAKNGGDASAFGQLVESIVKEDRAAEAAEAAATESVEQKPADGDAEAKDGDGANADDEKTGDAGGEDDADKTAAADETTSSKTSKKKS